METRFDGENVEFSNFATRFRGPEVRFDGNNVEFRNNRTTFDGEVRFEGPIRADNGLNIQGDVDFSGQINADRIYLNGPFGDTRFDGEINRISGMVTEIRSDLYVERDAYFEDQARFMDEVRLEGPVTDPKHATTKEYVDARIDTEITRAQAVEAILSTDLATEANRAQAAENNLLQLVQQQATLIEQLEARITVLENQ